MKRIILICSLFAGLLSVGYSQSNQQSTTDPVEKAKGLQKQLKLTDNQTVKIAAIYKESAQQYDKIKKEEHSNTNKMLTAIRPLRMTTVKKIKSILTPVQAAKYDKLLKEDKTPGGSGWGDGWSSAS